MQRSNNPPRGGQRPRVQPRAQPRPQRPADIIVNNYNSAFQLQDRVTHSLILNGHNNQIQFNQAGQKIRQATINGHNNFLFAQAENCSIDVLIVQGHNNKFESLNVTQLIIDGHNNSFANVQCVQVIDQGSNNQMHHSQQQEYDFSTDEEVIDDDDDDYGEQQCKLISNNVDYQYQMPQMPQMPHMPHMPQMPQMPRMPQMPQRQQQQFQQQNIMQNIQQTLDSLGIGNYLNFQMPNQSINITLNGQPVQYYQEQQEYYSEEEEEEEPVDEDGQPLPSPDQVKHVINSIPSFKFDRPSTTQSSKSKKEDNSKVCSVCLDGVSVGQQVKLLQCGHMFHAGCINNWLKQKLKCPTCRHRIQL